MRSISLLALAAVTITLFSACSSTGAQLSARVGTVCPTAHPWRDTQTVRMGFAWSPIL
jgi:hypothetical protein